MAAIKKWTFSEEKILIDNYHTSTMAELKDLLPDRDVDAINCKIKRMKKQGKLVGKRTPETVSRAHK